MRLPKADFREYVNLEKLGVDGLKKLNCKVEEAVKVYDIHLMSLYSWTIDEYLSYVKSWGGR
jgi:hypothetical protein